MGFELSCYLRSLVSSTRLEGLEADGCRGFDRGIRERHPREGPELIPELCARFPIDPERSSDSPWILWSSTLSPFGLKVDALCDHAGLRHRWMPAEGRWFEAIRAASRVRGIVSRRLALTWPEPSPLDEFPLVPFLLGPNGENLYDSTAIAYWLDATGRVRREGSAPLVPGGDDALAVAIAMVDEYFDEFGLYMVHHNRWKVAARDNRAGERLASEMRPMIGPLSRIVGRRFPERQVRRMPYLFSVADENDHTFDDLPVRLRPPSRSGFPPTHVLLEECFERLLEIMEALLSGRPYLFGERFTLADASAYGQLAMNLADPSAEAWIRGKAPGVRAWLGRIAEADFSRSRPRGDVSLDADLAPLLEEVGRVFVPLMVQNASAHARHVEAGETRFNEAAFDAGRALYDGELVGRRFRSVVKTFQVRVWCSLEEKWQSLSEDDRRRLDSLGLVDRQVRGAPATT